MSVLAAHRVAIMAQKAVSSAVFADWHKRHKRRLHWFVRRFVRANRCHFDLWCDLEQAALCEASLALSYWQADAGLNDFNWCAGPMLRGMMRCWRLAHGNKAYGHETLAPIMAEPIVQSSPAPPMPEIIDLYRALATDPKPKHVVRFLITTLSPSSGADIANLEGVCRQAVSMTSSQTRRRLAVAMGA